MLTYFGEKWDADRFDEGEAVKVDTPVGEMCGECKEPIQSGDRGVIRGTRTVDGGTGQEPLHTECEMLPMLGHVLGVCSCHGEMSLLTRREQSLLLLSRVNDRRRHVGRPDL